LERKAVNSILERNCWGHVLLTGSKHKGYLNDLNVPQIDFLSDEKLFINLEMETTWSTKDFN